MTQCNIGADYLRNYIVELFAACGVSDIQRRVVALNLVWSELIGRTNYGMARVPILVKRVEQGLLNPACKPVFETLSNSCARLDADNGFGHYAGDIAMRRAVEMAGQTGIGLVGVKNSNFYGVGAYFVDLAAKQGMVSLALSNSVPNVVAHGGTLPVFGTNPFAFGAPRQNGKNLMVDFATSQMAASSAREYMAKNKPLPEGLAILPNGEALTDPTRLSEGSLTPFGGAKGYGIGLMVEMLSGILTGSGFSHSVKSMYSDFSQNSNSGHCLIAIDISKWMKLEEFYQRFEMLIDILKASNARDEVLLPGEIRWRNHQENLKSGIKIPVELADRLDNLSRPYGVVPPWEESKIAMLFDKTS